MLLQTQYDIQLKIITLMQGRTKLLISYLLATFIKLSTDCTLMIIVIFNLICLKLKDRRDLYQVNFKVRVLSFTILLTGVINDLITYVYNDFLRF